MKKTTLAAALAATLAASAGSHASSQEEALAAALAEIEALKARLQAVESQVQDQARKSQEQDRAIAEKNRQIQELVENPEIRHGPDSSGDWFNSVEIGGVVEFEGSYEDPDDGDSSSDFVIATAELGIAAQVNDWVGSEITLLYEEDDTDLEVDVAIISIANPEGPWGIVAGQQYVPFGTFETTMISDPLTLELGETRETAVLAGLEMDGFIGGVYVFNGDKDDGDDDVNDYGAVLGYSQESDDMSFGVNVGYISNIGDADGFDDFLGDEIEDDVEGFTASAMLTPGPFTFIAEYTAAMDDFDSTDLSFKGNGAEPEAFNIEAAYGFMLAGKETTVAIGYQETDEAVALELPEERIRAGVSVGILENTTLSFEWARDDNYSVSDGGSGGDTDIITGQLAVEF